MAYEFKVHRRVEFVETDMAGVMHFSHFFRYMESVEHAFFRSLGLRVHTHGEAGVWGWVRAHAECNYLRPLRYEDLVELHLLVKAKGSSSLTYQVIFRLPSAEDPESMVEVARGSMKVICVTGFPGEGRLRSIKIPAEIDALVEVAPAELRD